MNPSIKILLEAWRNRALEEWQKNIYDKNGSREIINYFNAIGWNWLIANGYKNNARYAWCGIFAAYCGLTIGEALPDHYRNRYRLDPDIARMVLPSTARMVSTSKWTATGCKKPEIYDYKDCAEHPDVLLPGTVVSIATKHGPKWGGHIVIIDEVRFNEGKLDTIEGNGWGERGDGSWGEGVIRRRGDRARSFSEIRAVPLFNKEHFDLIEESTPVFYNDKRWA